jgi:TonB family protein
MIFRENNSPRSPEALSKAIKLSILFHLLLLIGMYLKNIVMPSGLHTKEYLPSLRVDLVALPSQKITETVTPLEVPEEKSSPLESTTAKEPQLTERGDYSLSKKKLKMKSALDRIKALEKIRDGETLKGNVVKKGSSAKGDPNTSAQSTYFDSVLDKVRNEWELPSWLQGKGFSAKVLIKIDRRGSISSLTFIRTSGNSQFDAAVKRTLNAAAPFSPPPLAVLADVFKEGIVLGFPIAD